MTPRFFHHDNLDIDKDGILQVMDSIIREDWKPMLFLSEMLVGKHSLLPSEKEDIVTG